MKIQVKIFLLFYFLFLSCEKSEPKSILETRKGYLTGIGNSTTNWKLKGITIDGLPQQRQGFLLIQMQRRLFHQQRTNGTML